MRVTTFAITGALIVGVAYSSDGGSEKGLVDSDICHV